MLGSFLLLLLTAVLACGGITTASLPKGILAPLAEYLDKLVRAGRFPEKWAEPLLLCDTCIATVWGNLTWFLVSFAPSLHIHWWDRLLFAVPLWFGTAFCNHVLWTVISTLKKIRDGDPSTDPYKHS